jgi:enediyne biosynthesis protein E4
MTDSVEAAGEKSSFHWRERVGASARGALRAVVSFILLFAFPFAAEASACAGDCDGNGVVGVTEIVRAITVALGRAGPETCPAEGVAAGAMDITYLVRAVGALLDGCSAATPTGTASASETATATETATPTDTAPVDTATATARASPTESATPTNTATVTASVTATSTAPPLPTETEPPTATVAPSPTQPDSSSTETPSPTETPAPAWSFVDVTAAAGLDYQHGYLDDFFSSARFTAGGVAAGDYDGDGWIDLYVVRGTVGPNLLFHNRGDGTFEEVGAAAGVALDHSLGSGPTFADFDGDGKLDLLVLGVGFNDSHDGVVTPPTLFRNRGDGTFEDVTAAAHLVITRDSYSASFADFDRDGDLDLFLTHWGSFVHLDQPMENLWRNNGDGTFTDVTQEAGITPYLHPDLGPVDLTFTANFADLDSDGWPDLLLASDFGSSRVFHNDGDGTFTETTTAVISDENGMGSAVGDYDGDGDLDWFVSSVYDPSGVPFPSWGASGNRLYRNRGDGTFEDATDEAGVREGFWGWGATFADLDNDGNLDLVHVNGWGPQQTPETAPFLADPTRVFVSRGDGTFVESAAALGIDDHGQGRGVVAFDYDRDGDLDLFIANNGQAPRLYRNDGGNRQSFLQVALRGLSPNTQGIGARVTITAGGRTQMRELRAGSNFVSQNPAEAHFGLGTAEMVDRVQVRWPSGAVSELDNVPARQHIVIEEPPGSVSSGFSLTDESIGQ